jgi:2',3'-cyclic-nucleotide 2'-phosphodiesterase (5'-nucleotidase family)
MKNKILLVVLIAFSACNTQLQVKNKQIHNIRIKADSIGEEDARSKALIAPYKLKLDSLMNIRIMVASADIKKEQPEGALGNMVCDLLMRNVIKNGHKPDFCVLNNGGLRIPAIYAGNVYIRTVYELMPFDNQLVMLKLKGNKCAELFELIAQNNGAPVSGLRLVIQNNQATAIQVQDKAFDLNKDYWILTSDYLANGGDKADALKNPIETINLNQKIRDVLIAQMKDMYYEGETLQSIKDGRITKN